jgi:hypothetical protein
MWRSKWPCSSTFDDGHRVRAEFAVVSTFALTVLAVSACAAAGGFAALAWTLHRESVARSLARVAALAAAIDIEAAPEAAVAASAPHNGHKGWLIAAAAAVPVVLVVVALLSARGPETAAAPLPARQPESLELLDMRHTRTRDTLTVTGTVRMRRQDVAPGVAAGHPVAPPVVTPVVTALVSAFETGGRVVASGHALLDDARLDLDGESSFKVAVPSALAVHRYEVRFETHLGTIPHIDRRPRHAAAIPIPSDHQGHEQP